MTSPFSLLLYHQKIYKLKVSNLHWLMYRKALFKSRDSPACCSPSNPRPRMRLPPGRKKERQQFFRGEKPTLSTTSHPGLLEESGFVRLLTVPIMKTTWKDVSYAPAFTATSHRYRSLTRFHRLIDCACAHTPGIPGYCPESYSASAAHTDPCWFQDQSYQRYDPLRFVSNSSPRVAAKKKKLSLLSIKHNR